jgi:RNA methyltransferase, TrmH family
MAQSQIIVSRDNSLLRQARAVRDGKDETLIFVEGLRLCAEALRSGLKIHAVIYSNEIAQKERAAVLIDALGSVCERLGEVSEPLLATVSYTKTPQGVIVLATRPVSGKKRLVKKRGQPHLLVVMDGINNPVNVGAIIRSAEAAGATGVITTGNSSDPFSPRALRGAMGSAFRLPIWHGASYGEALAWCAEQKIKTVCTDLKASHLHTEINWKGPRALILGSESTGLAAEQVEMTAAAVKIPMHGSVESLNVGIAAAVILYEAARQRMSDR